MLLTLYSCIIHLNSGIIKPQISPNGWAEDAKALIFRWFCGIDDAGIY